MKHASANDSVKSQTTASVHRSGVSEDDSSSIPRTPNKLRRERPHVKLAETVHQSPSSPRKLTKPKPDPQPREAEGGILSRIGLRRHTTDSALTLSDNQPSAPNLDATGAAKPPHWQAKDEEHPNLSRQHRSVSIDTSRYDEDGRRSSRPTSHRRATSHRQTEREHRRDETRPGSSLGSQNGHQRSRNGDRRREKSIPSSQRRVSDPDLHGTLANAASSRSSTRASDAQDPFNHPRFEYRGGHVHDVHFISSKFLSSLPNPATPPQEAPMDGHNRHPKTASGKLMLSC